MQLSRCYLCKEESRHSWWAYYGLPVLGPQLSATCQRSQPEKVKSLNRTFERSFVARHKLVLLFEMCWEYERYAFKAKLIYWDTHYSCVHLSIPCSPRKTSRSGGTDNQPLWWWGSCLQVANFNVFSEVKTKLHHWDSCKSLLEIPAMPVERGPPKAQAWKHMRVYFDWKSDGLMVGQCRSVLLHVTCSIKSIFLVVIGIFDGDEDDVVMCLSACDIYTARLWVPPGQLSIVSFSDGSSSSQRLATSLWYFMSLTDIWHWFFSLYFDRSPSPIKFYLLWALWFAWGVFIVFIWETKVVNKM